MSDHQITFWTSPLERIETRHEKVYGKTWLSAELKRLRPIYPNAYIETKDIKGRLFIAIFSGEKKNKQSV